MLSAIIGIFVACLTVFTNSGILLMLFKNPGAEKKEPISPAVALGLCGTTSNIEDFGTFAPNAFAPLAPKLYNPGAILPKPCTYPPAISRALLPSDSIGLLIFSS